MLSLRICFYIEVSFALKVRDEISFAFFHQVTVKRVLLIKRDQFPQSLIRDARARGSDEDLGSERHLKNQADAICFGIIVRLLQTYLTCEPILFAEIVPDESAGSLKPLRVIRLARFQRGSLEAGAERPQRALQERRV